MANQLKNIPEAGSVYPEVEVYVVTHRLTGTVVDVCLRASDAAQYKKGIGSTDYRVTVFRCT